MSSKTSKAKILLKGRAAVAEDQAGATGAESALLKLALPLNAATGLLRGALPGRRVHDGLALPLGTGSSGPLSGSVLQRRLVCSLVTHHMLLPGCVLHLYICLRVMSIEVNVDWNKELPSP